MVTMVRVPRNETRSVIILLYIVHYTDRSEA